MSKLMTGSVCTHLSSYSDHVSLQVLIDCDAHLFDRHYYVTVSCRHRAIPGRVQKGFPVCELRQGEPRVCLHSPDKGCGGMPANNDDATFSAWPPRRTQAGTAFEPAVTSLCRPLQDRSVRVWQMNEGRVRCVARGLSHTNAVGSITCSRLDARPRL